MFAAILGALGSLLGSGAGAAGAGAAAAGGAGIGSTLAGAAAAGGSLAGAIGAGGASGIGAINGVGSGIFNSTLGKGALNFGKTSIFNQINKSANYQPQITNMSPGLINTNLYKGYQSHFGGF